LAVLAVAEEMSMREAWLEALGNAANGAFIIDQEQRIIFWNQAAVEILGYPGDEIAGSYCYAILDGRGDRGRPICRENCYRAAAAARGRPVESFDMSVPTKSHGIRWLNISTLTWPANGNGNGAGILHLFQDVTSRKQRELLLDQVLDAAKNLQNGEQVDAFPALSTDDLRANLTDREHEVLSLLAEGLGTRDIARTLVISSSTTRNHIRNILEKLHVHSRLEAVVLAYKAVSSPKGRDGRQPVSNGPNELGKWTREV
jgi:PAS domain S-box-containing protein